MACDGSRAWEVEEVAGAEIPAGAEHQEDHADNSSVNRSSSTDSENDSAS
jgi:hypothetical protein